MAIGSQNNTGRLKQIGPTYSTIRIPTNKADKGSTPQRDVDKSSTAVSLPENGVQKAMRTVNSYIPTFFSQVNLNFLKTNLQSTEKVTGKVKQTTKPNWLNKNRDLVSKVSF